MLTKKQKTLLTENKEKDNKKSHTDKSDNKTCSGFYEEKAIEINDYCLNTKTNELFYAGDMIGKMALQQNKHYLKSLKCSLIEKDRTFPAVPKEFVEQNYVTNEEFGNMTEDAIKWEYKYVKIKKEHDKLKEENRKLKLFSDIWLADSERIKNKENNIPKEKFRELLIKYHIYANIPFNRKPTKLEKDIAEMTVESYLEDIGFNEKNKKIVRPMGDIAQG